MDWLEDRQDAIEAGLARRHLAPDANPARMALFDLSSSWLEGRCCPLAARGYSRDGKKGKLQIEYGLLTDPTGRPVAVRVLPGNTGDPANVHRDRPGRAGQVRPAFEGVARRVNITVTVRAGAAVKVFRRCLRRFAGAGDPGGLFATRRLTFSCAAVWRAMIWGCGRFFPSSRLQNRVCRVRAACLLARAGSADRGRDRGEVHG